MYTVPSVLKSCAKFSGIVEVRQFHTLVIKFGLWFDLFVKNSLVHVYRICGDIVDASKVFDVVVTNVIPVTNKTMRKIEFLEQTQEILFQFTKVRGEGRKRTRIG